jgi:hypothetical protein
LNTLLLLAVVAVVAELEAEERVAAEQVDIEQLLGLLSLWDPHLQLL